MVYSGLRIAAVPDCVTGVQRRPLALWQVVLTVTVLFLLLLFCFVLTASAATALGTVNLLLL